MYCNEGDEPIIEYQFGTKPKRKFKSKFAPIEVETKPYKIPATENYNSQGFQIRFYSPNNFRWVEYIVIDYDIKPIYNVYAIHLQMCEQKSIDYNTGPEIDVSTISINRNIKCPVPEIERCSLLVKYNGVIIYQDQGDCPVSVDVICGNCPPHHIECKSNKYPGYCCIGCESTANSIHSLANKIKNV